jgi:hypothetical protein
MLVIFFILLGSQTIMLILRIWCWSGSTSFFNNKKHCQIPVRYTEVIVNQWWALFLNRLKQDSNRLMMDERLFLVKNFRLSGPTSLYKNVRILTWELTVIVNKVYIWSGHTQNSPSVKLSTWSFSSSAF